MKTLNTRFFLALSLWGSVAVPADLTSRHGHASFSPLTTAKSTRVEKCRTLWSYYGGFEFRLKDVPGNAPVLNIRRHEGPDGDGEAFDWTTIVGKRQSQDAVASVYQFGPYELSLANRAGEKSFLNDDEVECAPFDS